jgi:hypothetical protein
LSSSRTLFVRKALVSIVMIVGEEPSTRDHDQDRPVDPMAADPEPIAETFAKRRRTEAFWVATGA